MNSVELCSLAVSLGAVDTLIDYPASMIHTNIPAEVRVKTGIIDDLLKISVAVGEADDIMVDLDQTLMTYE